MRMRHVIEFDIERLAAGQIRAGMPAKAQSFLNESWVPGLPTEQEFLRAYPKSNPAAPSRPSGRLLQRQLRPRTGPVVIAAQGGCIGLHWTAVGSCCGNRAELLGGWGEQRERGCCLGKWVVLWESEWCSGRARVCVAPLSNRRWLDADGLRPGCSNQVQ